MNRLILIGNGFDLAHDLRTSYKDFIQYHVANSINNFLRDHRYFDPLLKIDYRYQGSYFNDLPFCTPSESIKLLNDFSKNEYVNVAYPSSFFKDSLDKLAGVNWVDLEIDYFETLLKCNSGRGYNFESVEKLNIQFDFIKAELEKYLGTLQKDKYLDDYRTLFIEPLNQSEIITNIGSAHLPSNLLLLSFNYTPTVEIYREKCSHRVPTNINFIHGEIGSKSNPIIFGFGDEYNKQYQEFENYRNKELLKHIKSFGYFKTSNYHNLIRFIDSDEFQIFILGHSVGLSDRTMLKEIFEHSNCKSIKIFYHQLDGQNNDYTQKTYDLASHFSDKGMMRKKIVPFNLSSAMPQLRKS